VPHGVRSEIVGRNYQVSELEMPHSLSLVSPSNLWIIYAMLLRNLRGRSFTCVDQTCRSSGIYIYHFPPILITGTSDQGQIPLRVPSPATSGADLRREPPAYAADRGRRSVVVDREEPVSRDQQGWWKREDGVIVG
jgi:hypothetical protein